MRVTINYGLSYSRGFWEDLWWGYLYYYRYPIKRGNMLEGDDYHPSRDIIKEIKR